MYTSIRAALGLTKFSDYLGGDDSCQGDVCGVLLLAKLTSELGMGLCLDPKQQQQKQQQQKQQQGLPQVHFGQGPLRFACV